MLNGVLNFQAVFSLQEWLLDHDTDDLLKSMLTGNDIGTSGDSHNGPQVLLDDINGAGSMVDFDRQLLSPADSAVSSGSGSNTSSCYGTAVTSANPSIDLMDIFNGTQNFTFFLSLSSQLEKKLVYHLRVYVDTIQPEMDSFVILPYR